MEFDAFKQLVFAAIAAHDGMWSWYQLGRHVTPQAPEMARELMLALRQLEDEGRIYSVNGISSAQPLYAVGNRGAA